MTQLSTTTADGRSASAKSADGRTWRELLSGPSDRSARARVRRLGARVIGFGLLIFTAGLSPLIAARADLTVFWWPPLSAVLVAGPALILIAATYRRSLTHLTALAALCSGSFLAAVGLWFAAWNGDVAADTSWWSVWLVQFPGVAGLVFGVAGHARLAIAHIIISTTATTAANQLGLYSELRPQLFLGALLTMALNCVFLAIAVMAVRTAGVLDDTRSSAMESAADSAASTAQGAERARFAALIHDKVIAILLAVDVGRPATALVSQATSALDELDHRDDDAPRRPVVAVDEFVQRVRTAIATTDDTVEREFSVDRSPDARYPTDVVGAVNDAMCEAIRNVGRHAGPAASCLVVGDFRPDRVTVAVVDDGEGFDPGQVPPERLGVAVAIRRRMASVRGGDSEVRSAPGRGTTVVLRWVRDEH